MGMVQTGDGLCFPLESLAQFSAIGEVHRKNLYGNNSIETGIAGLVHLAHSARTDGGKDFVRPEAGARCNCHFGLDYTPRNKNVCHYLPRYPLRIALLGNWPSTLLRL